MQGPAPPLAVACPPAGFPTDELSYSRTELTELPSIRPWDKKQYLRIDRAIVKKETRPAHGPDTVVIKVFDLEKANPSSSDTLADAQKEVAVMRGCFHSNIVQVNYIPETRTLYPNPKSYSKPVTCGCFYVKRSTCQNFARCTRHLRTATPNPQSCTSNPNAMKSCSSTRHLRWTTNCGWCSTTWIAVRAWTSSTH